MNPRLRNLLISLSHNEELSDRFRRQVRVELGDFVEETMTDGIIDRATRALVKRRCGVDDLDALEAEQVELLREDVLAVLGALWQPIETAPRDDRNVLLARDGRVTAGWFDDLNDCWFEALDDGEECIRIQPTHWMPLPEAPKE